MAWQKKNKEPRGSGEAPGQVIQKDDHENRYIISRKTGVCKGGCVPWSVKTYSRPGRPPT